MNSATVNGGGRIGYYMGPLYYISKMTKDEERKDSPNDHFIPLTDQTNRRMLFDGHKQKLFGMSSIVLVAPKMPPTNRADQQRTWTRLTYIRWVVVIQSRSVQDVLHKNGLVQSWGSTKGLLLPHIRNPTPPRVVKVVLAKTSAPSSS